ncbi:MAG TPA: Ig-like domain-containing protein, partial [Thermoanaerobaculia bacterium]|nr:Ig-like domain-containing protein [Thermoanaerobaculia bacterium]
GASLVVSLPTGSPAVGIPITIISNDGSDPVVGTFNGLPEGTTFAADGTLFRISYHGNDGNDVTLTPESAVKSFVGLYHALWSNPSSWSPQALPVAGEPLSFALSTTSMTNDLPAGFTAGAMTFKGGNVDLEGNALTLTGDLSFTPTVWSFTCDVPVKIGNALTLGAAQSSFYSVVDVNAQTLTVNTSLTAFGQLNGSGTIVLNGPGTRIDSPGTFTGPIHGSVDLNNGLLPNADIAGAFLTGNGSVGNVVVTTLRPGSAGGLPSGNDTHAVGVLQTKSLTLAGGSFDVDLDPNGASDLVLVKGSASISGALNVSLTSAATGLGQKFVIIDNDGTDKINGTFANLPEGAAVHSGNTLFRISYVGGDGNDLELTAAEQPVITVTQPKSSTVIGEKATLTASFDAGMPAPLGSLTFAADGVPIGTAPIANGSATIDVSSLAIGDRMITASWAGAGAFLPAVSAPLTHTVRRGDTSTTLVAVDPLVYGSSRFTISVAVTAPAVTPLAGTVTLRENGIVVGTATLNGNAATLTALSLHPGLHLLIASYEGSSTLLTSESRPLTVSISPVETQLVVSNEESKLTVVASSPSGVVDIPTGTVTIAENGNTIAVEPIKGMTNIALTLNPGTHHLTVIYSGDANFLGDTVQYDVTIGSAPPSRHRGVRH